MSKRLSDLERRIVRETLEEIRVSPAPADRARFALPVALLGLVLVVGWPRVVDAVPGGDFVSPFVTLIGVVLVIGGPVLALLGRGGGRLAAGAAAEAALRRLEDPASDRETLIRASTLLVTHAYSSQGPATVETFDHDEARARAGSRLPLLMAVEGYLLDEGSAYPVFTLAPDAD